MRFSVRRLFLSALLCLLARAASAAPPVLALHHPLPAGRVMHIGVDTVAGTLVLLVADAADSRPVSIPLVRDSTEDGPAIWMYADQGGHEAFEKATGGISELLQTAPFNMHRTEGKGDDVAFINAVADEYGGGGILLRGAPPEATLSQSWLPAVLSLAGGLLIGAIAVLLIFRARRAGMKRRRRQAALKRRLANNEEDASQQKEAGYAQPEPTSLKMLQQEIKDKNKKIGQLQALIKEKETAVTEEITRTRAVEREREGMRDRIAGFLKEAEQKAIEVDGLEKQIMAANANANTLQRELDSARQVTGQLRKELDAADAYYKSAADGLIIPFLQWTQSNSFNPANSGDLGRAAEQLFSFAIHYISLVRTQVKANVVHDGYNTGLFGLSDLSRKTPEPKQAPVSAATDEYPELLLLLAGLLRRLEADGKSMDVSIGGYSFGANHQL